MKDKQRTYIAIDLKSFFASVECVERGLDPLTTNLVVADESRTEKTICLAVSPSLKAYGIGGRARLFEAVRKVREVNNNRRLHAPGRRFSGRSFSDTELRQHPELEADFIRAMPRMAFYIDYSTRVYNVYLKYIAPEDIHVYSIDEVFMDVSDYLNTYKMTPHDLAMTMIRDVLRTTGITASAGIGSNMYLAKVAMDIKAKHRKPDADGVRIAELDEMSYRRELWNHEPLRDFWRVGRGTAARLESMGVRTMGDLARLSLDTGGEAWLYRQFGESAELLIDHAWGWEPCTMDYIKSYRTKTSSMSNGQVLSEPYSFAKARNVVLEMADSIGLDLVRKGLVTDQLTLIVNFDRESLAGDGGASSYKGEISSDYYGRPVPRHVRATVNLDSCTSSCSEITKAVVSAYDRTVDRQLLIRRITISTNNIVPEEHARHKEPQPDLFTDPDAVIKENEARMRERERERKMQEALLKIKGRFGKNAILKGTSYDEGATARDRNIQIGGHKA